MEKSIEKTTASSSYNFARILKKMAAVFFFSSRDKAIRPFVPVRYFFNGRIAIDCPAFGLVARNAQL